MFDEGTVDPVHSVKAYKESGCKVSFIHSFIHSFLMLALNGGEWSTSPTCCFIPRAGSPETHRRGGWVGLTACLDDMEKGKIACS